jgi:hypothetical protein
MAEVVNSCPTPKLEGHPLLAVRDCLFNIFSATLQYTMDNVSNSDTCYVYHFTYRTLKNDVLINISDYKLTPFKGPINCEC